MRLACLLLERIAVVSMRSGVQHADLEQGEATRPDIERLISFIRLHFR
jgi:hypothetical protein